MRVILFGAAMAVCGVMLSGCDMLAPKVDVSKLSMAELEAQVAKGGDQSAAKLRLSSIYARYGTDAQKRRAYDMLAPLAERGNTDAALGLCVLMDQPELASETVPLCKAEADRGVMRAQIAMCAHIGESGDPGVNTYCRPAAEDGQVQTYLYYGEALAAQAKWEEARIWLEKSIIEGPINHRDRAIRIMANVVSDNVGQNLYYEALSAPNGARVAFDIVKTDAPNTPSNLRRDSQCYVRWTVTPTGLASRVKIDCGDDALNDPMARAVHKWRFTPSTRGGLPIYDSTRASTTVYFKAAKGR